MADNEKCKYFSYITKEKRGVGKTVEYIKTGNCRIKKRITSGCLEPCPFFESR